MERKSFFTDETVQDFIASSGDVHPRFEQLLVTNKLSDDLRCVAQTLPSAWNVLVIAEPWSGDVLYDIPPLIRFAEAAGRELCIFHRD